MYLIIFNNLISKIISVIAIFSKPVKILTLCPDLDSSPAKKETLSFWGKGSTLFISLLVPRAKNALKKLLSE